MNEQDEYAVLGKLGPRARPSAPGPNCPNLPGTEHAVPSFRLFTQCDDTVTRKQFTTVGKNACLIIIMDIEIYCSCHIHLLWICFFDIDPPSRDVCFGCKHNCGICYQRRWLDYMWLKIQEGQERNMFRKLPPQTGGSQSPHRGMNIHTGCTLINNCSYSSRRL